MSCKECIDLFRAALAAVDPGQAVLNAVARQGNMLHVADSRYALADFRRVIVVGAGKAAARMAAAVENLLGREIAAGLIIVKYGHQGELAIVRQIEASHPLPDEAGVTGTQQILDLLHGADEQTLVICLLSGGASALLVAPVAGITLQDKQRVTSLLLQAGASINELNAVRKHLSAVKGGKLARAASPATVLTLVLSDVIGNPLDVIASGPTAPDNSSFADAWAVLEKYQLPDRIPAGVAHYLQAGLAGRQAETMRQDDPCMLKVRNVIVGSIGQALAAAARRARETDWHVEILTAELQGEARNAARYLAARARRELAAMKAGERHCLLSGGETTVTVTGQGAGGRNQELALAFALEIDGESDIRLLSAGTDGNDGPTDAAGALVDGSTVTLAHSYGLEPLDYLGRNDSYAFFHRLDEVGGSTAHYKPGPTGTNVMDMQIILIVKSGR